MDDYINRQAAIKHLRKRLIETANNNVGFQCDAGETFQDASERVSLWVNELPSEKAKIKVKLDHGAYMPAKAHTADAGFDLRTPRSVYVQPNSSIVIDTGVHMLIPEGYVGMLKSKSGLNVKHGILCEGVVDAGYTGSIVAKLYNHGYDPVNFTAGDKITQIVILPIPEVELEEVSDLEETERGSNGFGSTGR